MNNTNTATANSQVINNSKRLKNYYFTFDKDTKTLNGFNLGNSWVTVVEDNFTKAKLTFIREFAFPITGMEYPNDRVYHEDYFTEDIKSSKPNGEYAFIFRVLVINQTSREVIYELMDKVNHNEEPLRPSGSEIT